jgi:hypothetical protein
LIRRLEHFALRRIDVAHIDHGLPEIGLELFDPPRDRLIWREGH